MQGYGGIEYQLEALEGQGPGANSNVTGAFIGAANADPRLARRRVRPRTGRPALFGFRTPRLRQVIL